MNRFGCPICPWTGTNPISVQMDEVLLFFCPDCNCDGLHEFWNPQAIKGGIWKHIQDLPTNGTQLTLEDFKEFIKMMGNRKERTFNPMEGYFKSCEEIVKLDDPDATYLINGIIPIKLETAKGVLEAYNSYFKKNEKDI